MRDIFSNHHEPSIKNELKLAQISQGSNVQLSFSYDALGRCTSKTVQGTATQSLYDGNNTVQKTQGSTVNPILAGLGIDERFARNDVTGHIESGI